MAERGASQAEIEAAEAEAEEKSRLADLQRRRSNAETEAAAIRAMMAAPITVTGSTLEPGAPVVLLVMGLGMQLTSWPDGFRDGLVAHGFRVIAFDNRGLGASTGKVPDSIEAMADDGLVKKGPGRADNGNELAATSRRFEDIEADSERKRANVGGAAE